MALYRNPSNPPDTSIRMVPYLKPSNDQIKTYCQLEKFQAQCPSDHVIVLTSAEYGRMRLDGRCVKKKWDNIGCKV